MSANDSRAIAVKNQDDFGWKENGANDFDSVQEKVLRQVTAKGDVVLLKNDSLVPVMQLGDNKIAYVNWSDSASDPFLNMLQKYTRIAEIAIDPQMLALEGYDSIQKNLAGIDLLIVKIGDLNGTVGALKKSKLEQIAKLVPIVSFVLGQTDQDLSGCSDALLYSSSTDSIEQTTAAQIVFGGISASGRLAHALPGYGKNSGLDTPPARRFEYTIPEMAGVDGDYLTRVIDSAANAAIAEHAFPGCQVLVAKNRKIIYHQSFGYHTYFQRIKVKNDDVYDLASVTKIAGTLPAVMQFVDQGKIKLDSNFSDYWGDFKNSNKAQMKVRDIFAHQSGLQAWIPYWRSTVDSTGNFLPGIFNTQPNDTFSVQVGRHLYLNKNYRKVMFRQIVDSPVSTEKKYVYSGLPFYILPQIIQNITGVAYPDYVQQTFYRPLGAYSLTFNAFQVFPLDRIVPTEYDDYFRFGLLHGFVDDEGAAMMGGVSGNAGLFSTANDLAKLMQMYLQMGTYGGERYISEETMKEFTRCQFPENDNRRGLVFDRPELGNDSLDIATCYPAYSASSESFGHSGYTGTFVWCDPKYQLVYIFFSNRVYPTRKNTKIYDTHVRMQIHQAIYDSIKSFDDKYSKL